jgi:hypothetical protein
MLFVKGEWEPSKLLRGMFNANQLEELLSAAFSAVETGSEEIHLNA